MHNIVNGFFVVLVFGVLLLFFFSSGVGSQGIHLDPLQQPFLVMDFFQDRIS
jgi:hypothetical protein